MDDKSIMEKAVNSVPTFVWALCGLMITFSMSARIAGLDISTPLNSLMAAYSEQLQLEVSCINTEDGQVVLQRLLDLESKAHQRK